MLGTLRRDPVWLALAILSISILAYFLLWPLVTMLGRSLFMEGGARFRWIHTFFHPALL